MRGLFVVIACMSAARVQGQSPVPPTPDVLSAVRAITIGTSIRVLANGTSTQGRFIEVDTVAGLVRLHRRPPITLTGIDSLWIQRTGARRGAIIGAALVGIPTLLGFYALCAGLSDGACDTEDTFSVIAFGAMAGGAGAVVGGLLGNASRRWELRFP